MKIDKASGTGRLHIVGEELSEQPTVGRTDPFLNETNISINCVLGECEMHSKFVYQEFGKDLADCLS